MTLRPCLRIAINGNPHETKICAVNADGMEFPLEVSAISTHLDSEGGGNVVLTFQACAVEVTVDMPTSEATVKTIVDALGNGTYQGLLKRRTDERDEWKRRAIAHGCDVVKGDPDCG